MEYTLKHRSLIQMAEKIKLSHLMFTFLEMYKII